MNKIVLNETHIRQLVRETLENLILGEDGVDTNIQSAEYYINNATSKSVDFFNLHGRTGNLGLIYEGEYGEFYFTAVFDIDGRFSEYDPGNYWREPSGGEFELYDISVYDIETYLDGDNIDMTDEDYNYIADIADDYCRNNLYELDIDEDYFTYEPDYDDYDD